MINKAGRNKILNIRVCQFFVKSGILKVGRGEMKDLYVYKWVPGQTN